MSMSSGRYSILKVEKNALRICLWFDLTLETNSSVAYPVNPFIKYKNLHLGKAAHGSRFALLLSRGTKFELLVHLAHRGREGHPKIQVLCAGIRLTMSIVFPSWQSNMQQLRPSLCVMYPAYKPWRYTQLCRHLHIDCCDFRVFMRRLYIATSIGDSTEKVEHPTPLDRGSACELPEEFSHLQAMF